MRSSLFHIHFVSIIAFCFVARRTSSFSYSVTRKHFGLQRRVTALRSSLVGDGGEYSSSQGDVLSDEDGKIGSESYYQDEEDDDSPTVELQPVPPSKNSGNRFVALVWDRDLNRKAEDVIDMHYDRIALTEDHVMFCRKCNLYNETFNTESMVDILWSLPILSSDLQRAIGHAMCLESTELRHAQETLSKDPIVQMLTGGDISNIPLYRWRHIRDYSLRIDDGRFGYPCMCLALDHDAGEVGNLRSEVWEEVLAYMIRSQSVIAAGPLHVPTEKKDDPASVAVGDLILFNAKDREHAIEFAENLPSAQDGLYKEMRVHFYNRLDVSGKFVSENPLDEAPGAQMKEALEYWGYPVDDDQTPWINW